MKRLTLILVGVFAFAFIWASTADAGIFRKRTIKRDLIVRVERKVEKKAAPIRLIPSRCAGGSCATK